MSIEIPLYPLCGIQVVVFPRSAAEVQEVVKAAHSARVPVVPRGAGSGLEGGAIPYQGGVVLDLMHMKASCSWCSMKHASYFQTRVLP